MKKLVYLSDAWERAALQADSRGFYAKWKGKAFWASLQLREDNEVEYELLGEAGQEWSAIASRKQPILIEKWVREATPLDIVKERLNAKE